MGVTLARVVKNYEEQINISYGDFEQIIKFLKEIDTDEYPLSFNDRGEYQIEFINSEFNRYCEDKDIENLPIQIKWLYKDITKPTKLPDGDFIELEWW